MEFKTIGDAEQYCTSIENWDFGDDEETINCDTISSVCYNNDCCIACAIEVLGGKLSNYGIKCECKEEDEN